MNIIVGTDLVDRLFGTAALDILVGNAGNDLLIGNAGNDEFYGGTGNDLLNGGAGNDYFVGGAGRDYIIGGSGFDTVDYSEEGGTGGIIVDLRARSGRDSTGSTDLLSDIERVRGSLQSDIIRGSDGNDQFQGLRGNDVFEGRDGVDWVDYSYDARFGGTGGIIVDLSGGTATDGFGDQDSLNDIENVRGSQFADSIVGDRSNNRIIGGAGNDTLDGGAGFDVLDYSDEGGAFRVIVDFTQGWAVDSFGNTDTISQFESAHGTARGDILVGDHLANGFSGRAGNDRIYAQSGNDEIWADEGDDLIDAGSGADYIVGGAGNDTVRGSFGWDTLDYGVEGGDQGIIADLGAGFVTDSFGDTDSVSGVEQVFATHYGDQVFGANVAENVLAGSGDDFIMGNGGDDTLKGEDGSDFLIGGQGNDALYGGFGTDFLEGGTGADSFFFESGFGNDFIQDFTVGEDRLVVDHALSFDLNFLAMSAFDSGFDTQIETTIVFDDGSTVTLDGVSAWELSVDHFDWIV